MPGLLTHPPADITRYLLISLGEGVLPSAGGSWPVYAAQTPNSPDNMVVVLGTSNTHQGRTHYDGEVQERHGVQILVRCITYPVGSTKANAIGIALDQDVYDTAIVIGSSTYNVHAFSRTSGPIDLGKETPDSKRDLFSINATVSLRQTS